MTSWQSTIILKDLWGRYDEDKITLPELVWETIKRCEENKFYPLFRHNVKALEEQLEECLGATDKEEGLDRLESDYDNFMDNLFDFGDFQHRIWVKT